MDDALHNALEEFYRGLHAGRGRGRAGSSLCPSKVKLSDALAVHPSQVEEAREQAKKLGVPTEFAKDGRAVITSRYHQKRLVKALGMFNRDGGYGD